MISVVMPSYNSAEFIEQAIDSVRAQTFPQFELLVCDDGSTDGTLGIVEKLVRRDDRIRLLRHGFRSVSRNCNMAMQQASFPWIARLDADDVMLPTRLEQQIKAVEQDPSVVLWGSYAKLINRHGTILRTVLTGPTTEEEFQRLKRSGALIVIQGPTVMFRRDLALRIGGYDPRFDSAEDLELLSRLMAFGSLRVLPVPLTLYRVHGNSITAGRAAHQERLLRYIELRNRAWLANAPVPSVEEFTTALDNAPARARLAEWIDGRARQSYRNARVHHAERRFVQAAFCIAKAVSLNPFFSVPRIRTRMSRALHRRLQAMVGQVRKQSPEEAEKARDLP